MERTALVVIAIFTATALAGCAQLPGGGLSDEEARQAYLEAFGNLDSFDEADAVGIESTATADGEEIFRQSVEVEPERPAFLIELFVADRLNQGQSGALGNEFAFGAVVEGGIEHSVLPNLEGNLSLRRDHVPDLGDGDGFDSFDDLEVAPGAQGGGPDLGPGMATVGLDDQGENITVESVEQITHKDRTAWRIAFTFDNQTMSADGEAIVYDDPRLPARLEVTMQFDSSDTDQHPLFAVDEVTLTVEFTYDDEVDVVLPDAERAPARIDKTQQTTETEISGQISPSHDDEVPLDEIELRIATPGNASDGGFGQQTPPPEEIHFTMMAANGSRAEADFELHYEDLDGDGYVSANDTFRAVIHDESHQGNVSLYWFDHWAMKYEFQPGFGILAGLVGLVAAAAIVKRK